MKELSLRIAFIGALLAGFAASPVSLPAQQEQPVSEAPTESAPQEGRRGRGNFDPAAFFARMDENGDGSIDKSEFRGPEDRFGTIDKDGDGKVTKEEFETGRQNWRRDGGQGRGNGGGGFNIDDMKKKLAAGDEEWAILKPRIEKLNGLLVGMRGGRGNQLPEMETLRTVAAAEDATPEAIATAVEDFRKARDARQAEIKTAREELREIVTPKQEAQLIVDGLLD